ncbi:lipoyltransferase [Trametes versicolor FP-101664 SS1]|uniref:lipoyltransferase n=1 Tax=Trametes versicolor (strain FP-101664) TaxID=717944 RepID=UPI0004623995|nr:lipoyltransferase [Trametes versicolor FP-101664 SS1]EIW65013.1 lipoyltransferase [Trametes versicolor FP-101664 SS1]
MRLPPIFYHCFREPLPYTRALELQERIHQLQLLTRKTSGNHRDFLFLLEHRPVYTFGRRQGDDSEAAQEALRLKATGADCVFTLRGGQTTYHGPGQIIGYPLIDLARTSPPMGIRDYICRMQKLLESHLAEEHGIKHIPSDNTGVFLDEHTKVASIGVQVRHRLTNHGFALNVTPEPLAWFNKVVACGLTDVKAGCISDTVESKGGAALDSIAGELPGLVKRFGRIYERDTVPLDISAEGEEEEAVRAMVAESVSSGPWHRKPVF